MDTKHLSYFKVENFKRFDSLEVNDIGQFNLIVGDNNVGKTSFLEALLFDENYDYFLINLFLGLENREIYVEDTRSNFLDFYLQNKKSAIGFVYQFANDSKKNHLALTKKTRNDLTEKEVLDNAVQLKLYDSPHIIQFNHEGLGNIKIIRILKDNDEDNYDFPFLGLKIFYDKEIEDFAANVSNSNKKLGDFIKQLKSFIPNIVSVEINNSIIPGRLMIIIRESSSDFPKPLAEYGDGFIKLFRCLLKIELCGDKRIMIDEIEAGIHYSRMKEFLKQVLQSAKNKNVQIFATTHSKECVKYYTQALEELNMQDNGRIIRIADTKIGIRAYTMGFEEFESAMMTDSEIR